MKPIITLSLVAIIVFSSLAFTFNSHNSERKINKTQGGFAVVELFTSEGCSSCPAADEVMIRLHKDIPDNVYCLAYHVDYWDYIGWKDPFSKAAYTERQRRYADFFKLNSIYTPQAVINGEKELVGSKEDQLRAIVRKEIEDSATGRLYLSAKKKDEQTISVTYEVNQPVKTGLNIALVQQNAVTNVKRGENSGRKLAHINIVRELKTINVDKSASAVVEFKIPAGLSIKEVELIAFVQDKSNMKISNATRAEIKE